MAKITIDLNKASDAKSIGAIIRGAVVKKRLEIGMTLLQQLAVISPVDTGRLRMGWMPSLNAPSDYAPDKGKYSFPDINSRAMQAWQKANLTDVLYVVNNVPYAVPVNNGTVKMAPRRFVERTITVVNSMYSG
ncbi:MAG: hypothetical protein J6T08_00680 [Lentisphaeria bacterium]|nr:hypothetical protein [Lentisphaeria bacterium]